MISYDSTKSHQESFVSLLWFHSHCFGVTQSCPTQTINFLLVDFTNEFAYSFFHGAHFISIACVPSQRPGKI